MRLAKIGQKKPGLDPLFTSSIYCETSSATRPLVVADETALTPTLARTKDYVRSDAKRKKAQNFSFLTL